MKTKINCDQLNDQEIHGWGIVEHETGEPATSQEDILVLLKAGGTVIGQQRRAIARPDVDKAVGQPGVNKGYRMPVLAPAAVLTAATHREPLPLTLNFGGVDIALWKQPGRLIDLGQFRSVNLADVGGPLTIADVWFATANELRFRVENLRDAHGLKPPYTIKFFQPEFAPGLRLAQIGETVVAADGMAFVSQFLHNPLHPLLITVCAANGDVAAMDALPFPSLCRGGLHHAELLALGTSAGYLYDLRVVSDTLLREIWDRAPAAKGRHISEIAIDLRRAAGAEPIFSADVLQWLVLGNGIAVTPAVETDGDDGDAPAVDDGLLGTALANSGLLDYGNKTRREPGLTLTIPADAVPSLAAVVSRRLAMGKEADASVTAFLTAQAVTGEPRWYVSLPPMTTSLAALQPPLMPSAHPVLKPPRGSGPAAELKDAASPAALAIRFIDETFKTDEQRILPVAPDVAEIIARPEEDDEAKAGPLVSVVVSVRNGSVMLRDLLASLATQTLASVTELILVDNRSHVHHRVQIEQAAAEHFKGRTTIIDADAPFNLSAQTNAGVAAANGRYVCLAHSDVILFDPRTLATLVTLAGGDMVGAASCMMLEPRPGRTEGVRFRSAGLFPQALAFGGRPRITFAEPDCGVVFGPATYPVAAVGFALACMRRALWDEIGGLDAERVATDFGDADFCLRALAAGYTNVCTTALAAFHSGHATRGISFDVLASGRLTAVPLPELLAKCTVLRRIS